MKNITCKHAQQGAVLVISLVLLTVLTLVGVASMSSSSLELKAASNAQQYKSAYEAAQSRIEFAATNNAINPLDYLIAIPDIDNPSTWPVQNCDDTDGCPDGSTWTATAQLDYTGGCGPAAGYSIEADRGPVMRTFAITVDAQNNSGTSSSVQVQGVRHLAAGC
jgi:type II secretory pathway pseudopilin PulG